VKICQKSFVGATSVWGSLQRSPDLGGLREGKIWGAEGRDGEKERGGRRRMEWRWRGYKYGMYI